MVLLISVIGLTLGLSLASRTTDDSNIATEIEDSSRAFSAAEAGLEAASLQLGNFSAEPTGTINSGSKEASYNVKIVRAGGSTDPYIFPGELHSNQPIIIWLNNYITQSSVDKYTSDTISLCWGKQTGENAAFEVTFYYKNNAGAYYLAREAYSPQGSGIIAGAIEVLPLPPSTVACGSDIFTHKVDIDLTALKSATPYDSLSHIPLMLKLRPIINNNGTTRLGVSTPVGVILPVQGEEHISVGTAPNGQKTKLVQFISFPAPPELFDSVIFSEQTLSK